MKLTLVNAQCFQQLSFMTLTIGDDFHRVVVSESKSGPTKLNRGF